MQNDNPIKKMIDKFSSTLKIDGTQRIQRVSWFFFSFCCPTDIDCTQAFSEYCNSQFIKTKVKLTYTYFSETDISKTLICITEKEGPGNFSKNVSVPNLLVSAIKLHIPKKNSDELRTTLLNLPRIMFLPCPEEEEELKPTAEQMLSDSLISMTLQNRLSIHSFNSVQAAKEKIITTMKLELKNLKRKRLVHGDEIETFWGVTLTFYALENKKRNFWIHGSSNVGKTLFTKMLVKRYLAGNINATASTHAQISKETQIVILDEYKSKNKFCFSTLNQLCDNTFGFKQLYANHFNTAEAIVIVNANRSLEDTYSADEKDKEDVHEQLRNRFFELDVDFCLREQGIEPADYLTSKYALPEELLSEINSPDPVDLLNNEEIVAEYNEKVAKLEPEICTVCGSRVKSINKTGNNNLIIPDRNIDFTASQTLRDKEGNSISNIESLLRLEEDQLNLAEDNSSLTSEPKTSPRKLLKKRKRIDDSDFV